MVYALQAYDFYVEISLALYGCVWRYTCASDVAGRVLRVCNSLICLCVFILALVADETLCLNYKCNVSSFYL